MFESINPHHPTNIMNDQIFVGGEHEHQLDDQELEELEGILSGDWETTNKLIHPDMMTAVTIRNQNQATTTTASTLMMGGGPTMGPTPLPLQEWIRRATLSILSREIYLETAMTVALELTNRLCLIVETNKDQSRFSSSSSFSSLKDIDANIIAFHDSFNFGLDGNGQKCDDLAPSTSLLQVQLNDIVPDNVVVHIANDNGHDNYDPSQSPNNVNNLTALRSVDIQSSVENSVSNVFDIPQLSSCDVCSALGAILFELFSNGQPLFMIDLEQSGSSSSNIIEGGNNDFDSSHFRLEDLFVDDDNEEDLFRDLLNDDNDDDDGNGGDELHGPTSSGKRSRRPDNFSTNDVDVSRMPSPAPVSNKRIPDHHHSDGNNNNTTTTHQSSKSMKAKHFLREQCGLPLSICRLVSDLLGAVDKGDQFRADSVLTSLEEARVDMIQMKTHPQRFLHDRTSPSKALEDTALFQQITIGDGNANLYGRGREMRTLMNMAKRVSSHVVSSGSSNNNNTDPNNTSIHSNNKFLCEAAFVSGHSGCGKSSIMRKLLTSCDASNWFLLTCKFDRQVAPLNTLSKAFNNFFGRFLLNGGDNSGFGKISQSLLASLDTEGFGHLCEIVPVFSRLFPQSMGYSRRNSNSSTTGNVGSGRNRLHYLFHILVKSLICAGKPVLIILDDLQWSDGLAMEVISDVVQAVAYQSSVGLGNDDNESRQGLFLIGSYRSNEADANLLGQVQAMDNMVGNVKSTQLTIGELSWRDINKMLSFKLGLPMRSTKQLSEAIFHKTRGHPLFVIEFLRSIITRDVLSFSVKSYQWTWDDMHLDLLSMSENVAEFLAQGLSRLDKECIDALKICSCLGFEVDETILELLDLGQFVTNMTASLDVAMKEGLMEKAGPIYAFAHDMLRESTYELIPMSERKALHKEIGLSLGLDPAVAKNAPVCSLAVDQINVCKDILDPVERSLFARLNLAAGKHSMTSSSFDQAARYFEAGISLLHAHHWEKQYAICLELYELSVVVSFMDGNVDNVSSRLDAILSNAKSFQDTLKARGLHLKVIASRGDYAGSTSQCLAVLAGLGEPLPENIDSTFVNNEITATEALLKGVTKDHVLSLPPMKNTVKKLHAMKFLSMLCTFSMYSHRFLHYLSSCTMVKLTLQFGFCEDSIHGLVAFSRTLMLEKNDVEGANRTVQLAESFLAGHNNEHALRAKLSCHIHGTVKVLVQPFQGLPELCLKGVNSGMMVGDVENACLCGQLWCIAQFYIGAEMKALEEKVLDFIRQMGKHKQYGALYGTMSIYDACINLTGRKSNSLEIKTNLQLCNIAKQLKNPLLLHHAHLSLMFVHFYHREYTSILELNEEQEAQEAKRMMDILRLFFAGISALSLARDTNTRGSELRDIGERSTKTMAGLCDHSSWNFTNKLHLLQAELHYFNGDLVEADKAYNRSIRSAREHKFVHEEALAFELHGIFLIENKLVEMGMEQLKMSISRYVEWGAETKVKDVTSFMELVNISNNMYK